MDREARRPIESATPGPRRPRRRRASPWRVVHLMALVAVVAMAIGLPPTLIGVLKNPITAWGPQERSTYPIAAVLAFFTPSLAAIALLRRRPAVRRLARSYGGAGLLAAAAAMAVLCARAVATAAANESRVAATARRPTFEAIRGLVFPFADSYYSPIAWRVVAEGAESIVAAVAAAWAVLALSGKGRRPSGLLEILGLLVGLGWVLWLLHRDLAPMSYSS